MTFAAHYLRAIYLGSPVFNGKTFLKHKGYKGNEGKVRKIKALFALVSLRAAPCGSRSLCLGSFPRITEEPKNPAMLHILDQLLIIFGGIHIEE
jgi:hypothetical protein